MSKLKGAIILGFGLLGYVGLINSWIHQAIAGILAPFCTNTLLLWLCGILTPALLSIQAILDLIFPAGGGLLWFLFILVGAILFFK